MARKEKASSEGGTAGWLVTFSDLVTLLLTFFVLLLSMSSMDTSVVTRINFFQNDLGFLAPRGAGRVPQRIELLLSLLEDPTEVTNKPERFKDLLFPDDVLPKEINRSVLDQNLEVLKRPDGLVLSLSDRILFRPDSVEVTLPARSILRSIAEMLFYIESAVNIAAFSDPRYDVMTTDPYALSADRSMAILDFFIKNKLKQNRFSISGYGPQSPWPTSTQLENQAAGSRVEILIKTTPVQGSYIPF